MGRFLVVTFIEENLIEIVPDNWEQSGVCAWPSEKLTAEKLRKLVESFTDPGDDWTRYHVKVMCSSGSYERAIKKMRKTQFVSDFSDWTTDDNEKINREKAGKVIPLPCAPNKGNKSVRSALSSRPRTSNGVFQQNTPSTSHALLSRQSISNEVFQQNTPSTSHALSSHQSISNEVFQQNTPSTSHALLSRQSTSNEEFQQQVLKILEKNSLANEEFQRKMLRMMEAVKTEVDGLSHLLSSKSHQSLGNNDMPADCPLLPVDTPEDLKEFNGYLDDKTKFLQICTYYGSIGGFTYTSLVRRILATILTNNLSMKYNWKGTGGVKLAFCQFLNVIKVITTSVRLHRSFERVTDQEIETAIKKWLVYSKDRDGGRALRATKHS